MIAKSKTILNKERIFFIGFSLYLIQAFIRTTMYKEIIPFSILKLIKTIAIILVLVEIITDKYTIKKIIIIIGTLVFFGFSLMESTYSILLEYSILIIGAKDISFRKIVKIFFYIELPLLLITIISSQIGIIQDLVYYRSDHNTYRHSFGVVYPTDFVAHVFFLCLAYMYIKGRDVKWYQIVIISLIAIITYYLCDTRLDSICIAMLCLLGLQYKFNLIKYKNIIIKYGLIFSFLICEVISIYMTINYDPSNDIHFNVNDMLSGRLRIGNMMYNDYGVKMFGQYIEDHGWGGSLTFNYDVYNYIDCSYLRILLKYGLVISILITIINIIISIKFYKTKNYDLLLVSLLIAINSIVAQHYIDFSYNFLLLVYLAKLDDKNCIEEYINVD